MQFQPYKAKAPALASRGFLKVTEATSLSLEVIFGERREETTYQMPLPEVAGFFMSYQHLAAVTGSAAAAEILRDICGRMKLNGGADHDGFHWVYVSAREAAEAANCCRNHAAKLLSYLEDLGLIIREKIGVAVGLPWVRSWFYRPGPECPDWLMSKASPAPVATDCPRGEQSIQTTTSTRNNKNRAAVAQKEQPHNIPGVDQTAGLIRERLSWPRSTPPAATHGTRPERMGIEHDLKLPDLERRGVLNVDPSNRAGVALANANTNGAVNHRRDVAVTHGA